MAIAILILDKAWDEYRNWLRRRQELTYSQEQNELQERRHRELLEKLDATLKLAKSAENSPKSLSSVEVKSISESKDQEAFVLLQWAQENDVRLSITLETDAEGDLKEAFETLTKEMPEDIVRERLQE